MSERDAHPDEGTIHAWLDRQLDDQASDTLEAHLQRCDECAERVVEARGLIAGASRILSSLDVGGAPASRTPAVEAWRPAVLPTTRARGIPAFRLTPARSAVAAVLVVAVATAIAREHQRTSSTLASRGAESAVIANAPAAAQAPSAAKAPDAAPMAGAAPGNVPAVSAPMSAPMAAAATPRIASAPPAVAQLDTSAGARVATARTFAKAQRETTVNADLARVGQVPAPAASASAPASAQARVATGLEAPQCYRVESATGAAATWGPVSLPFVLALDAPATGSAARVLTPAGQDAEARAVFERRSGDSLVFTLRRIGYTGTLAVGAPGEVRAGVMRSAPSATLLESTVVTAAPGASERRALRKPSAAQPRADSATTAPEHAAPAVPVVVRKVECR